MKKTLLYSFLPCLMAMLMCTTFTACGDDDEEETSPSSPAVSTSNIVGSWYFEEYDEEEEETEKTTFIFKSDGTLEWESIYIYTDDSGNLFEDKESDLYTYKVEGDLVLITIDEEDEEDGEIYETHVYKIVKIDSKELHWAWLGEYDSNGEYSGIPEEVALRDIQVLTKK